MFPFVSVRHVGAHPDELQHGVSIQSSINLGKTFPRISRIRIIPSTQILARVFVYLPPFISKILDFISRVVLIFILIYFEWRDTENQQLLVFSVTPFKIDQNKNQNRLIDKVQNKGNERSYMYKDPCQDSGQRNISYTRYPKKCFTQIYRDLYGDAMLVLTWMSSNMADGNQQKHLLPSFATKA